MLSKLHACELRISPDNRSVLDAVPPDGSVDPFNVALLIAPVHLPDHSDIARAFAHEMVSRWNMHNKLIETLHAMLAAKGLAIADFSRSGVAE